MAYDFRGSTACNPKASGNESAGQGDRTLLSWCGEQVRSIQPLAGMVSLVPARWSANLVAQSSQGPPPRVSAPEGRGKKKKERERERSHQRLSLPIVSLSGLSSLRLIHEPLLPTPSPSISPPGPHRQRRNAAHTHTHTGFRIQLPGVMDGFRARQFPNTIKETRLK